MTRFALGFILTWALALPALAALEAGQAAPDFTAQASRAGKAFNFSLKDALRKGPVVVYFFPSAYTSGCDIQAHDFAANHDKFIAAGATVVGVSLDSINRLNAYSADPEYCGGKVAVASDTDGRISKSYDLKVEAAPAGATDTKGLPIEHGMVEQITFVIAPDGRIANVIRGDSPSTNVRKALEAAQRLAAKQITRR